MNTTEKIHWVNGHQVRGTHHSFALSVLSYSVSFVVKKHFILGFSQDASDAKEFNSFEEANDFITAFNEFQKIHNVNFTIIS